MKLIAALLFLSCSVIDMNAQKFTQDQAKGYAAKLYESGMLSEKGRDLLVQQVDALKSERIIQSKDIAFPDGFIIHRDISLSYILLFCAEAFRSEMYYRFGVTEFNKMLMEAQDTSDPFSKRGLKKRREKIKKVKKEFDKKYEELEGYKLEEAIVAEDSIKEGSIKLSGGFGSRWSVYGLVHPKRSVMGKTLSRTISDLVNIGLIDEKVHRDILSEREDKGFITEYDVLNFAAERAMYYEDYSDQKAAQIALLDSLKKAQVLPATGYEALVSSYKPFELKARFDFVRHCNNSLVFDLANFSKDPGVYYPFIFDEIKKIVRDFDYSNLTIKVAPRSDNFNKELIDYEATISFVAAEKTYTHTFFHDYVWKKPRPGKVDTDTLARVSDEFHKGINKLLRDRNSPYRLYYVNRPEPGSVYPGKYFGLILMTENQYRSWGKNIMFFIREENHDNTFRSDNIANIIREYERIGLFSHLSAEEKADAIKKVAEKEINSYQDILVCFPRTIVSFDWEMQNYENPYEEITLEFAGASRGGFKPEKIIDRFKKDTRKQSTKFGFELNGHKYEADLTVNSDWMDARFLELIEKAISESGVDGKLYYCPGPEMDSGFMFLTTAQYEYLKSNQPIFFQGN